MKKNIKLIVAGISVVLIGVSTHLLMNNPNQHSSVQPVNTTTNAAPVDIPSGSAEPANTTSTPIPATAPKPSSAPATTPAPTTKELYTHSFDSSDPSKTNAPVSLTANNTWNISVSYVCPSIPPQPLILSVYDNGSSFKDFITVSVTANNLSGVMTKQYPLAGNFDIHGPDYCAWDLVITENL
jgi:membrane-associated protease RseP (regulator of RpoE activity)